LLVGFGAETPCSLARTAVYPVQSGYQWLRPISILKNALVGIRKVYPASTLVESWSNPFSAYYLTNTTAHKTDFEQVRVHTEEAQAHLINALHEAGPPDINSIQSMLPTARLVNTPPVGFCGQKPSLTAGTPACCQPGKTTTFFTI